MTFFAAQLRLQNAIVAVLYGDFVRYAAKQEDVDRMAIHRRLKGIPIRDMYNKSRKLLGRTQEFWLANWAIIQGKLGHSLSFIYFRYYA
jgi:hypothetical protein